MNTVRCRRRKGNPAAARENGHKFRQPAGIMNDSELDALLKENPPHVEVPASFSRSVWHRIETQEACREGGWRQWISAALRLLARPALAAPALVLTMAAGAWLGHAPSKAAGPGHEDYARSVSPFLLSDNRSAR
jgi:hypothetical protein